MRSQDRHVPRVGALNGLLDETAVRTIAENHPPLHVMARSQLAALAFACALLVALVAAPGCWTAGATEVPLRAATGTPVPTHAPLPTVAPAPEDPPELRAVWVDAFHEGFKTPAQVDRLVSWAREANLNALFVQVRRRGDAYYGRSLDPRTEDPDLALGFDPLQYLVDRAHQGPRRLQVHAWLATLPAWNKRESFPTDPLHVMNRHGLDAPPEESWLMLRDDGSAWAGDGSVGTYYVDPGNPAAARYTADVFLNVVRNYEVDGIHLDQVRYFEGRGLDRRWGYNPTSVGRFNAALGRDPASRPEPTDPDWMAWRRDQATALVRRIYLEAKAAKPQVVVSAAVVAWGKSPEDAGDWERSAPFSAVFQDWRYWLQEGLLDYAIPMDYYREEDPQAGWLDGWAAWQQDNRGQRAVAIGLGAYLNDTDATLAQLRRIRGLGPLGVALYSYAVPSRSEPDDGQARPAPADHLREAFPRPAPPPELPWQTRAVTGNVLVEVPGRGGVSVSVAGPVSREWTTDGTGLAGGTDLPAGRYSVVVTAPNVDAFPAEVLVTPGKTSAVRFSAGLAAP